MVMYRIVLPLVISVVLSSASTGNTQPSEQAKAKFIEGVAMIQTGQYEKALIAFEASYALRPKALVTYNIAMCEKALLRFSDALLSLDRYLAEAGDNPEPDMRSEAKAAREELRRWVGWLNVLDAPDGAVLTLNEKQKATLPLKKALPMNPGQHALRVTARNYRDYETDVTILSGELVEIHARLRPVRAMIVVSCAPEQLGTVLIDGVVVGNCPYAGNTEPGLHTVQVQSPGNRPFEREVTLSNGKTIEINARISAETHHAAEPPPSEKVAAPTPRTHPISQERSRRPSKYFYLGTISTVLGGSAAILGLVFHIRAGRHAARANSIESSFNGDANSPEYREFYDIRDHKLPTDNAVLSAGYASAVVFLGVGTALLVINRQKRDRGFQEKRNARLHPSMNGFVLVF